MIDAKFSAEAFAQRSPEESRQLADQLQDEVSREMQHALESSFRAIVTKLNFLGHELKLYDAGPGEISFRDDKKHADSYVCKLRLACDLIISAGYADTLDSFDVPEVESPHLN